MCVGKCVCVWEHEIEKDVRIEWCGVRRAQAQYNQPKHR